MNRPANTETIFVRDLNANDEFVLHGHHTVYVCESRSTTPGQGTSVTYRVKGSMDRWEFHKPSLSTVYRIIH